LIAHIKLIALIASILLLVLFASTSINHVRGNAYNSIPAPNSYAVTDTALYPMQVTFTGWKGDTGTAINNLRNQLADLLAGRSFSRATTSVKVVFFEPNDSIHPIFSRNASVWLPPASVEKLFTSSSTIWALGSKYAFSTKLDLGPKAVLNGSTVVGNVVLRPSGDPTFTSSDFDDMAEQLHVRGITTIQGDIISDLSGEDILTPEAKKYLAEHATITTSSLQTKDSSEDPSAGIGEDGIALKTPTGKPPLQSMIPPVKSGLPAKKSVIAPSESASGDSVANEDSGGQVDEDEEMSDPGAFSEFANFSIDRNIVTVTVTAGRSKGAGVSVHVWPPLPQVAIVNHGKSGPPGGRVKKRVRVHRRWKTIYLRTRSRTTLHVTSIGGPEDPRQVISVSGVLPARSSRRYSFAVRNVPLAMAAMLKFHLQQRGIQVTGTAKVEKIAQKGEAKNIAETQTSLMELLSQMNKRSDNYLAESMFRKLSTIVKVAANTPDERARTLMRSWLRVCNIDGTKCTLIDGSGLSHANRVSANTVIDLLHGIREQGMFDLFTRTMSIAGYDGTLRGRMIGTPAQYNAHGKTGTLNGVTALAGYVVTGDGQLAAYFITMQDFRGGIWGYKQAQNQIVEALASFKYANYIPPPPGTAASH
jgi:PBP4 family serine-type D-alanyl-D-alanine carboxypeptidase